MTSSYPLAFDSWGFEERDAILRVLAKGRYTMGEEVAAFEQEFAEFVGAPHAVMVNSGSTANLLALTALVMDPAWPLERGDEVIVPAVSWSTTYAPLYQLGLRPRFVDVDPETLNIDTTKIEAVITDHTTAVFAVNLLGNPCNFSELSDICAVRDLALLVDNCESLGATYQGHEVGDLGHVGTYSFFFSHHLQTMEGGMVVTHERRIADYLRCLRAHGWTRDLPPDSPLHQPSPDWFEESFKFLLPGYSVRPLEMSGAVGRVQLRKLPEQLTHRRANAEVFCDQFLRQPWCVPYRQPPKGTSSWFGFPVVLKGSLRGRRSEVVNLLRSHGIETRPIVAGNFLRHPAALYFDDLHSEDAHLFPVANNLHDNGFFLGNSGRDLRGSIERARYWISTLA